MFPLCQSNDDHSKGVSVQLTGSELLFSLAIFIGMLGEWGGSCLVESAMTVGNHGNSGEVLMILQTYGNERWKLRY